MVNVNDRVTILENSSNTTTPATAGGAGGPARFGIATPPDSPFAPTTAQEPRSASMFSSPPPRAPQADPWAQTRWGSAAAPAAQSTGPELRTDGVDRKDWAVTNQKVSKQLVPFNGDSAPYKNWNERVRDHFKQVNPNWSYVFNGVESSKVRIPISECRIWAMPNGMQCDLKWAAQHLWSFIRSNITDTVHIRCLTLTMNEDDNGLELWRMLFLENEGGAEQVEIAGMTDLHSFPSCPSAADVLHYTDPWNITRMKHGNDLPDAHLRQMFLNMVRGDCIGH